MYYHSTKNLGKLGKLLALPRMQMCSSIFAEIKGASSQIPFFALLSPKIRELASLRLPLDIQGDFFSN